MSTLTPTASEILAKAKQGRATCNSCRLFKGKLLPWVGAADSEVDVLFISDYPRGKDATHGTFRSDAGEAFKKILKSVLRSYPEAHPVRSLKFKIGYGMQCGIDDQNIKPTANDAAACSWLRDQRLSALTSLKLIVPMGKLAAQSIGIKESNFDNVRGKLISVNGIACLPTFHPAAVYLGSGLLKIFTNELSNILETAVASTQDSIATSERIKDEIKGYKYPKTLQELKDTVNEAISYRNGEYPLAVDTETNTLEVHLPTAKCIAFSFAWDVGKSAACLMNHKNAEDPGFWWYALPYIFNLLLCKKPKIAHNFQFDLRVFRHLVRCLRYISELLGEDYVRYFNTECNHSLEYILSSDGIENVQWDTMLAEHALEEDKKGFYGLKSIIRKYAPLFVGYEKSLKADEGMGNLKTLGDYIEFLNTKPEIQQIRDEVNQSSYWLKHFSGDRKVPTSFVHIIEEYRDKQISDLRDALLASKEKKALFKEAKAECVKIGTEYKLLTKTKDDCGSAILQDFLWLEWFKIESKKDQVKLLVKDKAKDLKESIDREKADINFENFAVDDLLIYAAIDTDMTIRSALEQIKLLNVEEQQSPSVTYSIIGKPLGSTHGMKLVSNPMCVSLSKMVDTGVCLNYKYLDWLEEEYTRQADTNKREILAQVGSVINGVELNLNSAAHAAYVLQQLGYPLTERTASGQIQVTKQILKSLSGKGSNPSDLVPSKLLTYRESLKARDTFLKNFRKFAESDGRIHPSFHQIGTATYRLSSSNPNFQNIPKKLAGHNIKKCLVPSDSSMVIANIDAAGAEVKVLTAYLSALQGKHRGQQLIHEMNNDPKFDMHSQFCAFIFGPVLWGLDVSTPAKMLDAYLWVRANKDSMPDVSAARSKVKAVVFGTLYGQTEHGLSNLLGISLEEAAFIIKTFFEADPSIAEYVKWSQDFVRAHGYITTMLGRRRRFPLVNIDRRQQSRSMRQGTNFLIQSLTVDIFNRLISSFIPTLINDLGGRPLMQVHDAIVMEFPRNRVAELPTIVVDLFENKVKTEFPWFPVPFKCDVEVGESYGELDKVSKFISRQNESSVVYQQTQSIEEAEAPDIRLKMVIDADVDPDDAHKIVTEEEEIFNETAT